MVPRGAAIWGRDLKGRQRDLEGQPKSQFKFLRKIFQPGRLFDFLASVVDGDEEVFAQEPFQLVPFFVRLRIVGLIKCSLTCSRGPHTDTESVFFVIVYNLWIKRV